MRRLAASGLESGAANRDGELGRGYTNGGGLSYTHTGMYGMFLLLEATRQLRGECGDRQVEGAKLVMVNGTGGILSSCGTLVLAAD